ncbi:MAG: hypothetical protein LBV28_00395 [Puniceicoccales bacterium]|nr:hypothetical protein [Puniceicoccales bacterium]
MQKRSLLLFFFSVLSLTFTVCASAAPAVPANRSVATLKPGTHGDLPITQRHFANARAFSNDPGARKLFKSYANPGFKWERREAWGKDVNKGKPETWVEYGAGKLLIYVPDNYDGSAAFGVYLHVSPVRGTGVPRGYESVLRERKLIFVSPYEADNDRPYVERVAKALDALATAKTLVKVDTKRVIVGGLSGGGHIAFLTQMLFPDLFKGAVSHAAQSYLSGHFPGYSVADCKQGARRSRVKWAVISGDKDFNYKEILDTSAVWKKESMPYRFFDVKGMGHSDAPAENFAEALDWIEGKKTVPSKTR